MQVLVTGAKGFIGKNLIAELRNRKFADILEYGKDTKPELLDEYCSKADYVLHLAGVNRPQDPSEFMEQNLGVTTEVIDSLVRHENKCPVLLASSIQAELDNPYGISKRACEAALIDHSVKNDSKILIYRLPNVFGKWCKPNYNSVVATFCYNVAHGLPIQIDDPEKIITLLYIDDVVDDMIAAITGEKTSVGPFCELPAGYSRSLGEIASLVQSFKRSREERSIPNMSDLFVKKLYSTYLSYLPEDDFSYALKMNSDSRGSFTEFIKTVDRGQVSVNISKPGITKGNHWHHTKNEKFLVVAGKGVIRFRRLDSDNVIEYYMSGEKLEVVDIPTGFTHNIENIGDCDMVTVMWANESYDPERPDTFPLEV
ncbi:capsular polysaccharide biosynthesis protein CapF [Paenibacillus sp. TRM 82003]|nr:capsular polysaccharide biosynthesis protein CapF [Paenibacillus sp. TRM 82003]